MTSRLSDFIPEGLAGNFADSEQSRAAVLALEPGFHNLIGQEEAWSSQPEAMDFLRPASPYFQLKRLSTAIYRHHFAACLDCLPREARVLDAGCGIGRFTVELADRFADVTAFDPCRRSLDACRAHLAERNHPAVALHWADLSWLDTLPAASFDLLFAAEVICYVGDPELALRRLARVSRPGARLLLSVEAKPGALTVRAADRPGEWQRLLAGEPLLREGDCFVRLFDETSLGELLERTGWRVDSRRMSHFFGEGPFWQSLDDDRLADPGYFAEILAAEEACRADPRLAPWGRVLSVTAHR